MSFTDKVFMPVPNLEKNRAPTPVYLDPGMHSGLEVKGLMVRPDDTLRGV